MQLYKVSYTLISVQRKITQAIISLPRGELIKLSIKKLILEMLHVYYSYTNVNNLYNNLINSTKYTLKITDRSQIFQNEGKSITVWQGSPVNALNTVSPFFSS